MSVLITNASGSGSTTNPVVARAVGATATITSSFSNLTWSTVQSDTGSGFAGASNQTTYTIPSSGYWSFTAQVQISASTVSAGQTMNLQIWDSTNSQSLAETFYRHEGTQLGVIPVLLTTDALNINSGIAITIRVLATTGTPVIGASTVINYLSIVKVH